MLGFTTSDPHDITGLFVTNRYDWHVTAFRQMQHRRAIVAQGPAVKSAIDAELAKMIAEARARG